MGQKRSLWRHKAVRTNTLKPRTVFGPPENRCARQLQRAAGLINERRGQLIRTKFQVVQTIEPADQSCGDLGATHIAQRVAKAQTHFAKLLVHVAAAGLIVVLGTFLFHAGLFTYFYLSRGESSA